MIHSRRKFFKLSAAGVAVIRIPAIIRVSVMHKKTLINMNSYTFVNVGFGDTCVINIGGHYVIVDAYKSPDCGEDFTGFINNSTVKLLILTHRHYDHCFGIDELLKKDIYVEEAWESKYTGYKNPEIFKNVEDWEISDSLKSEKLMAALTKRGTIIERPVSDHKIKKIVNGFKFYVLNPLQTINEDTQNSTHDGCMFVKMVNPKNENEILFCGDTSPKSLERILNEEDIANTRILCSSHHGALDSLHKEFVKKVNPEYTIISSKPNTWREIPEKESLDFYAANSRKGILKTYEGTIHLSDNW